MRPCPVSLIDGYSPSSMCEYLSIQNLISSYIWWPRNGSWSFPSSSSLSMGACRTLNSSQNSSKSLGKVLSKQLWQPVHGYSLEGSTQVIRSGIKKGNIRPQEHWDSDSFLLSLNAFNLFQPMCAHTHWWSLLSLIISSSFTCITELLFLNQEELLTIKK